MTKQKHINKVSLQIFQTLQCGYDCSKGNYIPSAAGTDTITVYIYIYSVSIILCKTQEELPVSIIPLFTRIYWVSNNP